MMVLFSVPSRLHPPFGSSLGQKIRYFITREFVELCTSLKAFPKCARWVFKRFLVLRSMLEAIGSTDRESDLLLAWRETVFFPSLYESVGVQQPWLRRSASVQCPWLRISPNTCLELLRIVWFSFTIFYFCFSYIIIIYELPLIIYLQM